MKDSDRKRMQKEWMEGKVEVAGKFWFALDALFNVIIPVFYEAAACNIFDILHLIKNLNSFFLKHLAVATVALGSECI